MTDIRQHLPTLIKRLRAALDTSAPQAFDVERMDRLRGEIAAALPGSYRITNGPLLDMEGGPGPAFDLLIVDRALAERRGLSNDGPPRIDTVLAALLIGGQIDDATLAEWMERIARIKALTPRPARKLPDPGPAPGVFGARLPTHRLPLAMLVATSLDGRDQADSFAALRELTRQNGTKACPEYIYLVEPGAVYRNPLIDALTPAEESSGLSRYPDNQPMPACYVCGQEFARRHFFYDTLCQTCGDFNYARRMQRVDLRGRIALITGGRLRVGYAVALRLLRAGAQVIITTRFPHDAARRYTAEVDAAEWRDRLQIYGLDLRHLASLGRFIEHLEAHLPCLDLLVNNAAQTVRRPPAYYQPLMAFERLPRTALPPDLRQMLGEEAHNPADDPDGQSLVIPGFETIAAEHSQLALLPEDSHPAPEHFPPGMLDEEGHALDLRPANSWTLPLEDVSLPELLEVQLVNVTAPALLLSRLKGLMLRSPQSARIVINVSSIEGQFASEKSDRHTHTNMAKAALNMLTRSVAASYAREGIYVNSVDPGWVSMQSPQAIAPALRMPIDLSDAAARVCDPLFQAVSGADPQAGLLLKNYRPAPW